MALTVKHDSDNTRYELLRDAERIGVADYHVSGNTIVFTHTEVDPAERDQGMASRLVQDALDDVRDSTSYQVKASCPYVAAWVDDHPDYQDLLSR